MTGLASPHGTAKIISLDGICANPSSADRCMRNDSQNAADQQRVTHADEIRCSTSELTPQRRAATHGETPTLIQPKIAVQVRAAVDPQMKDQRRAMPMKIPTVKAIGQIFWDHCQPSAAYLARLPAIANSISARLLLVRLIRINVLDKIALLLPTRAIADPFPSEYRPLRRRQAGRMAQARLKTIE